MLIQALCNYYDILSAEGKVLPEGYSKVKIHYLISLTEEGTIDNIINVQREIAESKKEKVLETMQAFTAVEKYNSIEADS